MKIAILIVCFFLVSCNDTPMFCEIYIKCNPETTDFQAEYEKTKKEKGCDDP